MAKRFTATEKWLDPWFCSLSLENKMFWIFLVDNCDHAGIWQVNWPLVKFHLGVENIEKEVFKGRIFEISDGKWFIPKFIEFQYGGILNPANRTHASVISILEKEAPYKGLVSPIEGVKGTGKVQVNTKDEVRFKEPSKESREAIDQFLGRKK